MSSETNPKTVRSAADGFMFIDVSADECQRRSMNRKIDP